MDVCAPTPASTPSKSAPGLPVNARSRSRHPVRRAELRAAHLMSPTAAATRRSRYARSSTRIRRRLLSKHRERRKTLLTIVDGRLRPLAHVRQLALAQETFRYTFRSNPNAQSSDAHGRCISERYVSTVNQTGAHVPARRGAPYMVLSRNRRRPERRAWPARSPT